MSITALRERGSRAIAELEPYVGGLTRAQAAARLGISPEEIVKLSSNENPLGPSPAAVDAIIEAARLAAYYPTSIAAELHEAIGHYLDVRPAQVVSGPGSSTLMHSVIVACSEPGGKVVWIAPGFTLYQEVAKVHRRRPVAVQTHPPQFILPPEDIIGAMSARTEIVFVTRPNNPTSVLMPLGDFRRIAEAAREVGALVISDEAYIEFADHADQSAVELLKEDPELYENVVISRTFSKAFGLANVRLGYMVGTESVIGFISAANAKWPTGELARAAGLAALSDREHLVRTRETVTHGRLALEKGFNALGFNVVPGAQGNYVMVDVSSRGWKAAAFSEAILEFAHVMIRGDFSESHVRVSVGTPEENALLLKAAAQLVSDDKTR